MVVRPRATVLDPGAPRRAGQRRRRRGRRRAPPAPRRRALHRRRAGRRPRPPLAPGQIRDSNRPTLLAAGGGQRVRGGRPRARSPTTRPPSPRPSREGAATCDAVVTSGGVSDGRLRPREGGARPHRRHALDADRHPAGQALRLRRWSTATPVFGLPGNPVSSMVSFELLRPPRPAARWPGHAEPPRPPRGPGRRRRGLRAAGPTARSTSSGWWPSATRDGALHVALGRRPGLATTSPPWPRPTPWPSLPDGDGVAAGDDVARHPPRRGARRLSLGCGSGRGPRSVEAVAAAAGRLVRARAPRPAHLGHRPLQLPLHLLHARGGHGRGCPATSCSPSRRSSASPGCWSSASASTRSASPAASPPCGPTCPSWSSKLAALGVDLALTTNGATLGLLADDLAAAGLRRINISLDSLRPDRFAELTRRDELDQVLDGIDAAVAAGLAPVKVNVVVDAGRQRRRDRRLRHLRPRAGRHGPLHRVHAARRRRRVDGRRRSSPRPRSSAAIDAVFPLEPMRPGPSTPPSASATRRRGRDRRDPERHRRRSAAPATGSASPPRASCATACSPSTSTTCGRSLRGGGTDDDLAAAIEAGVGGQVGRPPDQPGALHPAAPGR